MARLEPPFPKSHGKPRIDDRRVLPGIVFINRNGSHWCDAPNKTVRIRRSTTSGNFEVRRACSTES